MHTVLLEMGEADRGCGLHTVPPVSAQMPSGSLQGGTIELPRIIIIVIIIVIVVVGIKHKALILLASTYYWAVSPASGIL
jgi:hypothetical protein